ncbi:CubicO group peptidase (beta-lactamase class C family) [Hephaestia caeni]|uniref:CubicO group peptidase (Beta-lactamase class C family) n=1 Tax=Hephaestia caeni TaxID=645617 RepID=A0A397P3B7_9SPHN|nr:serine hydrolase [Hephaestia caeni]RIA43732.1 CubicO group peptidase (beta-lactamase class C family) [Hephaestia caeni]
MRIKSLFALPLLALLPASGGAQPQNMIAPLFVADPGTRAVLLIEDGRVIAKRYAPGFSDANRFISWSMAKTVTAMLVGELVADGKLALDAPAPVPEWHRPGDPRGAITLRMLLQMRSGLRHTEIGDPIERSDTNQVLFVGGTGDMAAKAIAQPLEAAPGTKFEYSSLTTIILAKIIADTLTDSTDPRVRATTYRDFATERLFQPAGVTSAFLEFDGAGTQIGGSLIYMTLDDWGRMGRLLLDGTGADGAQVIAPDWLAFMKAPSPRDPEYGGQTWLNRAGGSDPDGPTLFPDAAPDTVVSMIGHLGQFVIAGTGADPHDPGTHHAIILVRLGKTQDSALAPTRQALGRVVGSLIQ